MDVSALARLQFGMTTVYHFFFVPLSIGMAFFVALTQTRYVRSGSEMHKSMTHFWGRLLLVSFAMGVVTGIVQEFQFGMNWSEYSRFVGDIFGAPLAIEALAAFFIESVFLGIWIFGWDKLSKRLHLASIWLVAFASVLSSYWILVANSFMQNPVGYQIAESGRAEMTDFLAVITNPNVLLQFPHVVLGGLTTGAFFVAGISAWHLLRNRHKLVAGFHSSLQMALVVGFVSVMAGMFFGHLQGQRMADTQPMKLAAAEGLWESEDPAGLSMFQIGNEAKQESLINLRIPSLLSFMTYNTPDGLVHGIKDLQAEYEQRYGPGDYAPPAIWLTYWSFRAMIGAGAAMALLSLLGIYFAYRKTLLKTRWLLNLLVFAMILPWVANTSGWLLTEIGRQPWIVQGLMTIDQALSPNVTAGMLAVSVIGFALVYSALIVATLFLLQKFARDVENEEPAPARPQPAVLKSAY